MVFSGFYFCSYDQMFIESTWLIVMDINPVVYQWIILFRNGLRFSLSVHVREFLVDSQQKPEKCFRILYHYVRCGIRAWEDFATTTKRTKV